ncbi:MAG: agmatine deiminase family protein [Phycisphaerales bacterium]|nr:agmatine deiminase family protein [Phycisphaerales bacterium]
MKTHVLLAAAALAAPALGQTLTRDGRLRYDADPSDPLPRNLTPLEAWYVARHPIAPAMDAVTPPPTGPVHCAAEYEPTDGIIVSWMSFTSLHVLMAKQVTTIGDANFYVALPSAGLQASASAALAAGGANMARVKFLVPAAGLNSVWLRDYGPRYIFQGDCRAIVDHTYNRPRPQDDVFPAAFGLYKHHAFYEHQLVHGGGNYHLDDAGNSFATRLVSNENPGLSDQQIHDIWRDYQNVDTTLMTPFPTSIDSTQHIDMWMQEVASDRIIISDWPLNPGSVQDVICDDAAVMLAARGYQVTRVPAFKIGGTHYTYTNMVVCNGVVMVPSYTNATVAPSNAPAAAAIQGAFPGRTVVQIPCESIIPLAGAIHCIVMHVPRHRGAAGPAGGLAPTSYLVNLNGGYATPGTVQEIRWISDDDESVSSIDLLLSTDGGQTFPTTIAAGVPDTGSYNWSIPPGVATAHGRVRVLARDGPGNTGGDASDADVRMCYADCNSDGVFNLADFGCFTTRFALGDSYGDCNGDGARNLADFGCFQTKFAVGCP